MTTGRQRRKAVEQLSSDELNTLEIESNTNENPIAGASKFPTTQTEILMRLKRPSKK